MVPWCSPAQCYLFQSTPVSLSFQISSVLEWNALLEPRQVPSPQINTAGHDRARNLTPHDANILYYRVTKADL